VSEETNGSLANVQQLFAPRVRRYKELTLPISGLRVRIQSLTEREVSAFQAATITASGTGLKRSKLEDANRRFIALCLVDGAGNRLLNDSHVSALAEWDGADSSYLYNECAAHAGLKTEDIEGLTKNSGTVRVAD